MRTMLSLGSTTLAASTARQYISVQAPGAPAVSIPEDSILWSRALSLSKGRYPAEEEMRAELDRMSNYETAMQRMVIGAAVGGLAAGILGTLLVLNWTKKR